jgi:hypothetical protein
MLEDVTLGAIIGVIVGFVAVIINDIGKSKYWW